MIDDPIKSKAAPSLTKKFCLEYLDNLCAKVITIFLNPLTLNFELNFHKNVSVFFFCINNRATKLVLSF